MKYLNGGAGDLAAAQADCDSRDSCIAIIYAPSFGNSPYYEVYAAGGNYVGPANTNFNKIYFR